MRCYQRLALLGLVALLQVNCAMAQFGGLKLPNLGGSGGIKAPNLGNSPIKAPSSGFGNAMKAPNLGGGGIKAPSSGFGGLLKTPNLGGSNIKTPTLGGSGSKTPSLGGIKAPTSGFGGLLKTPTLGGSGSKTPTLGGIKAPTSGLGGLLKTPTLGGSNGPTFAGSGNKTPPKKDNGGVTSSVDWKTAVAKDPPQKTKTPPIGNDKKPGPTIATVLPGGGRTVLPKNNGSGFNPVTLLPLIPALIPQIPQQQQPTQPQVFATQPHPQQQPIFQSQPQPQSQPVVANYVEPAPQPAPGPRPLPQNSVMTKKRFAFNPLSNPVGFNLDSTQAETDARQEVEAREAIDTLDSAISKAIGTVVQATGDAQMNADWNAVFQGGNKTEDVQKFLEKYGPPPGKNMLPADVVETIGIRQEYAKYADALRNGSFTSPEERDQALTDLQTSLTTYNMGKNPKFAATLQDKLTNMQNYNTMGKLAVATAEMENPYPTLIQGATQMEMPLAFVSEMTGYPVMGVEPIVEQVSTPTPTPTRVVPAQILLHNPEGNPAGVGYMLAGYEYAMQPGDEQLLDRQYVLAFDPGNGTQKHYTLGNGYYEWRVDPQTGWDVYKTKVKIEIDNSRYDGVFEYLVNGELVRLAAGEVAEHSSEMLIEVAFHSGREGIEHFKRLKPGRYIVGLDPEYGALDLFPATKVVTFEAKQPEYFASTEQAGSHATKAQRVEALLAQIKKPGDQAPAKVEAAKPAEKSAAKKVVSPLGKKAPAASIEDLLKSIKTQKPATLLKSDTLPEADLIKLLEGQPNSGPLPAFELLQNVDGAPTLK